MLRALLSLIFLFLAMLFIYMAFHTLYTIAPVRLCVYVPVSALDYQYCYWTNFVNRDNAFALIFLYIVCIYVSVGCSVLTAPPN